MVPALRRYATTLGVSFTLSGLLLSGCASSPHTAFDNDPATRQAVQRAKGGDGTALQSLQDAALAGKLQRVPTRLVRVAEDLRLKVKKPTVAATSVTWHQHPVVRVGHRWAGRRLRR